MVKKLSDGSLAVGLFNRSKKESEISVDWSELNLKGKRLVRDLWHQKDLGHFNDKFCAIVPAQGVVMVRIAKK
jgi:alpha-galactosidase